MERIEDDWTFEELRGLRELVMENIKAEEKLKQEVTQVFGHNCRHPCTHILLPSEWGHFDLLYSQKQVKFIFLHSWPRMVMHQ